MASFSKIFLIGNVGSDPTLKQFEGGGKVAEFSLAVNDSYTDRGGNKVEKTEWYRVSVWNQRADIIMQYVKKGGQLFVDGKLTVNTYTEQTTGKERYVLNVLANDFQLLGSRQTGLDNTSAPMPGGGGSARNASPASPEPLPNSFTKTDDEDDLPF